MDGSLTNLKQALNNSKIFIGINFTIREALFRFLHTMDTNGEIRRLAEKAMSSSSTPLKIENTGQEDLKKELGTLKQLMEKLKDVTAQLGLRLELDREYDSPLVRVFNEINNRQITTIPLYILLSRLVKSQAAERQSGANQAASLSSHGLSA